MALSAASQGRDGAAREEVQEEGYVKGTDPSLRILRHPHGNVLPVGTHIHWARAGRRPFGLTGSIGAHPEETEAAPGRLEGDVLSVGTPDRVTVEPVDSGALVDIVPLLSEADTDLMPEGERKADLVRPIRLARFRPK